MASGNKRRPGRPKTSPLTRRQQQAVASRERRAALKAQGYKAITVYLSPKTLSYLDTLQAHYGGTQAEVLEQVLESVATGQPLPEPDSGS